MLERSNIDYPLWRKKVDATFLRDYETPIPNWLLDIWNIQENFDHVRSKSDIDSKVDIIFNNNTYPGFITKQKTPTGYRFRLSYDKHLMLELREAFLMTYMRSLEGDFSNQFRFMGA